MAQEVAHAMSHPRHGPGGLAAAAAPAKLAAQETALALALDPPGVAYTTESRGRGSDIVAMANLLKGNHDRATDVPESPNGGQGTGWNAGVKRTRRRRPELHPGGRPATPGG